MTEKARANKKLNDAEGGLALAARGLQRGDDLARWQSIIDKSLDQYLEARQTLRRLQSKQAEM